MSLPQTIKLHPLAGGGWNVNIGGFDWSAQTVTVEIAMESRPGVEPEGRRRKPDEDGPYCGPYLEGVGHVIWGPNQSAVLQATV